MKEYVDREKVIEVFENSDFDVSDCDGYQVTPGISIEKFYDLINSIPNADVVEVKHGKWEDGNEFCPCCGENKFKDLYADIWADWKPKYCPNCGAKMDLEE